MKKVFKVLLGVTTLFVVACGSPNKEADKNVKDLRTYVDSVDRENKNYYEDETYWSSVEQKYVEQQQRIDAKNAELSKEAKEDYAKLQADYILLKEKYAIEKAKLRDAKDYRLVLRNSLFGEGKIGSDMSFEFMTSANALGIYETFVANVDNNKESYSREDWDEIKVLYEAMDNRKNEIESTLAKKDNSKIAGLKIKFAAIKALNRPLSKLEENARAKN